MRRALAAALAGVAGAIAWILALTIFFGPAQAILANPAHQSGKFLTVMGELEPLPRVAAAPWILPVGLLVIGVVYGIVYSSIREALGRSIWTRGLRFGLTSWALMALWFEFYLPWNAMHEPAPLVLLELVLWLAVMLAVGLSIAAVYERIRKRDVSQTRFRGTP
jgi:hypothetical protein